ncbi:MAG: hypothetical protein ORN27_08845, partial [Rhodoluna sp.]|nr:hypothetical protein [Rhodoluna sp.]
AVNGSITVTAAGNTFLAKAMGDITTGNSVTVQTNRGNIIFWPNSDKVAAVANNSGRFASGTNLTLRSQGGQIRIAGGLDDGGGDATITSAKGAWSSMAGADGLPDGYGVGNSTSGQSAGVLLSSGYTLSSAGGDIFIAGMDAPTTSDTSRTIQLVDGLIDSGAGRIALWAKAYANATLNEGMVLHTTNNTAGSIITSANRTAQAITLYSDTSPNTNGSSDGINVYGHGTNTTAFGWQALEVIATGAKDTNDLVNFPGGGIAVTGIASGTASNGGHGIVWQWADALAKDGQVTFTGQNNEATGGYSGAGIYIGDSNYSTANHWGAWHAALTYTNLAGTATDFATSSSNITLNANKFVFYEPSSIGAGSGYWFDTSGDVTIQSIGTTFTSDQGIGHWQFNNIKVAGNPRNFTVGKPTDTSYFLWWADLNVTGEIKFYGRYVFIVANTDLITTQAASGSATRNTGVLIKTTEKTYFQGTNVLQTGGSDITIWQDRDNDGVGALYSETGLQLKSNGGNINIAGGLDDGAANFSEITGRTANDGAPDNYSSGFSGWGANGGVDITGGTYQILSGGGDIFIAGRGSAATGEDDYGVLLRGGLMYSNAGKIAIYGKAPASCNNNWHRGIALGWNGDGGVADNIISNSTAADAIKLSGDMASCNNGVSVASFAIQDYFSAGSYIATPNGGGITVYGQQGNASASGGAWQDSNQESSILELNYTNIVSNSGPITITGARVSGSGNHSVRFNTRGTGQANSVGALSAARSTGFTAYPTINITSSTSDVTVTGDSQVLYSTTFRNTGDLVLQPYAANFDRTQYFSSGWAASFPATYKNVRIGKAGT